VDRPVSNFAQRAYTEQEQLVADDLVREFHDELMGIARSRRRRAQMSDTMLTMDLLHEAYIKLRGTGEFSSVSHFLAVASLAIRQVIIDHARRKLAAKRSADAVSELAEFSETPEQLVAIGALLDQLGEANPNWLRVVDARYFAGLTEAETAAVLGRSERSIRRDWHDAKAWLAKRMV
jgi:RNA polymerase sigma factor (TIGR02999 family)